MTKIVSAFSFVAIIFGVLLHPGVAGAQAIRTWVSGAGNDNNPCTRASPCATFDGAYNKTVAGGEIDVLGAGDFGTLTIYHAITIANDGAGVAAITPGYPPTTDDGISIHAGSTDAVVLRGLRLIGYSSQRAGIAFDFGGSLLIDHCTIEGFQTYAGVSFAPISAGSLWVKDTVLSYDGTSSSAGLLVLAQPTGGALTVHLERVQILHAIGNGIRVDGTQGPLPIDVELRDVTVDGATGGSGVVAVAPTSGGPTVNVLADNVTSSHNAGYGFRVVGATAKLVLSHSVSEDNGVGAGASSGGVLYSYGDNRFEGNVSGDGVTPTPIAQR